MTGSAAFTAELLKRSAAGYAAAAAARLLEQHPALREQGGALAAWRTHLSQRLLELAAAVAAEEPRLFRERVLWSYQTFVARDLDTEQLQASLESLRAVLAAELPARAAEPALTCLDAALQALVAGVEPPRGGQLDPTAESGRLALGYLNQVLEGDTYAAAAVLIEALQSGHLTAEALYLDVLLPAQEEIGRLWHGAQASVAEEHLVSATTRRVMAIAAHLAPRTTARQATVVSACATGNAHDLPLRAIADLFHLHGWRSLFLGADVPTEDLPAVLSGYDADVLLLSASLSTQLEQVRVAVETVREQSARPVGIIVGGAAFDEAPALAVRFGADAYAPSAREALRAADDWLAARSQS